MATNLIDQTIKTINRDILRYAQKVASQSPAEAATRLSTPVEACKRIAVLVDDEIDRVVDKLPCSLFKLSDKCLARAFSDGPSEASKSPLARIARIWMMAGREMSQRSPDATRIFFGLTEERSYALNRLNPVDVEMAIDRMGVIEFQGRLSVDQWRMVLEESEVAALAVMNNAAAFTM